MPNFKSISFEMTELQGACRICPPPHVYVCYPKDPLWNRVKREALQDCRNREQVSGVFISDS